MPTGYRHISNEERRKWDVKLIECVFIRYSINSKGFRLWNPKATRIRVSRVVILLGEGFDGRTTGCLPNQGNQGKIREMRVDLKISGKNQGNPLIIYLQK